MLEEFIQGELFLSSKNDFFGFGFVLRATHNKLHKKKKKKSKYQ